MPDVENTGDAPVIPAGTEKNLYGLNQFPQETGKAPNSVPTNEEAQGETAPANPENAPQGTTFEELAAKKGFKSADDLAKSYAELEKSHTKQSMDISELMKARQQEPSQAAQAQMVQKVQDDNPDMSQDEAIQIVEKLISKQVSPLKEELEILRTFKSEEEQRLAPQAAQIVKENPGISWKLALEIAQSRTSSERLKEQGTQEAYQSIQKKQAVQADSVQTGIKKEVNLEDLVNNKDIPFSEVQKIMKQRFNQ